MITIDKERVGLATPEGYKKHLSLRQFKSIVTPRELDLVLPTGVKAWVQRGNMFMAVYEIQPGAYSLNWMGRQRTLALPYVVLMLPFYIRKGMLTPAQIALECYYRNEPITSLKDKLYYPALLNCGHWASLQLPGWMCASRINLRPVEDTRDNNRRLLLSIAALRNYFFGATFNDEWMHAWKKYVEWEKADNRIKNELLWEKETAKDPSFILGVEWMPAERNLINTIEYTFGRISPIFHSHVTAYNLESAVLNH